jgi:flagellar biosynthesis/type III secretory pathway ATPase
VSPEHARAASQVRAHLALYEQKRDLIALGAYARGTDKRVDAALARSEAIESFLRQPSDVRTPLLETVAALTRVV